MADQLKLESTNASYGLATDLASNNLKQGQLTDALNANVQSIDGEGIQYSNDQGSVLCFQEPSGYKVIGSINITQLTKVIYFLANPTTGHSLISYVDNNNCTLLNLLDDTFTGSDLLNFNINHPIHKVEVKTTNCSTQFYFTDNFNHRRYVDLNNLPWKNGVVGSIDTNKMLIQPVFTIPIITPTGVNIGGNIIEGDYQFTVCYADVNSNNLTSFYSVTNPVRIFLENKQTLDFNLKTNKSITLNITDLDTSGLYSYFNLAVVKTINSITTVELVGTYNIQTSTYNHTYTGEEQSNANIKLSITDILEKSDYYDLAGDLTQVDNVLAWADLTKVDDKSYQKIWNQVLAGWGTWQIPVTESQSYHNGVNCSQLEGFMRDEVYALEGCLLWDDGRETNRGHIPGRASTAFDLSLIFPTNEDIIAASGDKCSTPIDPQPRWKVYNTGSITSTDPNYIAGDSCYKGPYQYGLMSYWESIENYPNKPEVWGTLSNTPIRHHKFPDSVITHIHGQNLNGANDNYITDQGFIYPIGFKVDILSLYNAIQTSSDLTSEEKRRIVGFKIMRSDRAGNTSILAKGMFYNMGEYTKDSSSYYYPNYPFNDVNPDPYISSTFVNNKSGDNNQTRLNNFQQNRFTFHSPDTHFDQPSGISQSFVKLETIEYGYCKAHFVPVLENAKEKLRTQKTLDVALAAGIVATLGINVSTTTGSLSDLTIAPVVHPQNFFPSFNNMLDIVDKLIPYYNYGWQYNAVGCYGNFTSIPNENIIPGTLGTKQRYIQYGGYILPGLNGSFGDDHSINNSFRESSVFISTASPLPFTFNNPTAANPPADNSRVIASQVGVCGKSTPFFRNIASYYGSIKQYLPGQYGEIFSYNVVDTGFTSKFFDENGKQITDIPVIFGGDIFINPFGLKIKHSFYNKGTVNKVDGSDIDYNQDQLSDTNTGNVGYPIWYYSTDNLLININSSNISGQMTNFINTFNTAAGLIGSLLTLGILPLAQSWLLLIELATQIFFTLGLKITNLDCANYDDLYEKGEAYLYAYGIANFFVESQVNVDMRQAYNNKEGNFYPNVGSDIPDEWLQETNVPIIYDNTYTYNKTYSKENHESYFSLLRPDWEPNQLCYTNFNNRVIWSDKSDLEESKNNWLVYRPANQKNLPKGFGKLVAIDSIENRQVLVRYENRSQIYNALATVATSGLTAALGTGELFSGVPLDLSNTDNGYYGSQNKWISNNEEGHIFTDAKRGQICLLKGTNVENLASPKYLNSKWFTNNMPFNILNYFPTVDIDNNFNGVGLHGTYDGFYHRILLTKLDYIPIVEGIQFDGTNFFIGDNENQKRNTIIQLTDPTYFCNKSWTISFSFLTNSWISWHSFQPNGYVEYSDYFQAILNNDPNLSNNCTVWDHNSTFSLWNNYFGVDYPYILEYPFIYKFENQILQSVKDYCTVLQYTDFDQFIEPNEVIYFDNVIAFNNQQCTGTRNLIVKNNTSLFQSRQYPKYNPSSIDILVTKDDNFFNYNMLWDSVVSPDVNIWKNVCGTTIGNKILNDSNINYNNQSYKKYPLRAKDSKIRLTLLKNQYKIISKFIIEKTQKSIK